ncbi:MAG: Tad domain-containing protein [Litorimonas sp.]
MNRRIRQFGQDERGNVAIMTALTMLVGIGFIGSAIDLSLASNTRDQAQNLSDALALSAAKVVGLTGGIPTDRSNGGYPEGTYTATELGFDFGTMVEGGNDEVTVKVAYDLDSNEAIVTILGTLKTGFGQMVGLNEMDFGVTTRVVIPSEEIRDVVSVALVLDNSGSMAWDDKPLEIQPGGVEVRPAGAVSRISALESSVNGFMDQMDPIAGDQTEAGSKIFRTGMLAYNTSTISSRTKTMDWRLLSRSHIDAMTAGGGTMPASSLTTAASWLKSEPAIHKAVNQKDPLRYAVFMTDGVNSDNVPSWVTQSGTGKWGRTYCEYSSSWSCFIDVRESPTKPQGAQTGYWNDSTLYATEFEEGDWSEVEDDRALKACQDMKNDGVTVYTIGFALEPGKYDDGSDGTVTIPASSTDTAYSFLAACASTGATFIRASNAAELQTAFDTIGTDIVEAAMRIAN